MAAPWADLHSELLVSIAAADGLSLRDYTSVRGVCTAWRSAIEPPSYYPCLLSLPEDKAWNHSAWHSASVFSLPMRRSFHLQTASSPLLVDSRGSVSSKDSGSAPVIGSSIGRCRSVSSEERGSARVVDSSNGRFAVAVDQDVPGCTRTVRIFLLDPGAGKEVELASPTANRKYEESAGPCHKYVHKVVLAPGSDDGTVVALYDHKHVAYIDVATSQEKWTSINVLAGAMNTEYVVDLAFGEDGKLYCLESNGCVHVLRIPGGGHDGKPSRTLVYPAAFVPPYDIAPRRMTAKNLFFCHGSLYQVWENNCATIISGGFRMSVGKILVLRYNPGRRPRWDAVKDLGGCSVFIGKSNSRAVVRAAGVPGVRADCVYWIDWRRVAMVCDIATGTSKPHVLPYGACRGNCWYFDDNNMTGIDGDGRN